MNTRSSSWTQKAPRSLDEAFGPYCGHEFVEKRELDWQDKIVIIGSVITFACFVLIMAL